MTWRQLIARAWRIFWRWYWRPRRLEKIERLEIALGIDEASLRRMENANEDSRLSMARAQASFEIQPGQVWEVEPASFVQVLPSPFVVNHDEMERQHKTAREVRALQRIADANRRLRPSSPSATKTPEPAGVR